MKAVAKSTYDFEELRKSGAVYVDKTGMLRDLITSKGDKLYFIARPMPNDQQI